MSFLKNKLSDISLKHIMFLEIESDCFWIVNSLPGGGGFFLRNLMAKVFFKRKTSFCWIQPRVTLVETNRLSVGKNFGVNTGTYINAKGGITIGDDVLIGANVTISSGMHPIDGRESSVFSRPTEPKPIVIEDDVWIGAGAVIMPGVTLKKGTVVGANSTVTHDSEPYSVIAGSPAIIIRYR